MPAITLGLAEIEARVHLLRRRLNTVALLGAAFRSVSVVCFVAAGLVALGLRGNTASFRALTWSGLGLVAAVLVACGISTHRHWLDMSATAALADQRGQLTDRLTTLMDLRNRPRTSRLAPVLLAQTLALGERWRPQRIAPRRVPRSLFLMLLSLLALTASPLLAPEPPPPTPATPLAKNLVVSPRALQGEAVPLSASLEGHGGAAGSAASGQEAPQPAAELQAPQVAASAESAPDTETPLGLLPDRLRNAILSAFHAEHTEHGGQPGKGAGGQSPESAEANANEPRDGAGPAGAAGHPSDIGSKSAPQQGKGTQGQQGPGAAKSGDQSPGAAKGSNAQTQNGSAPNAGSGSSPENLLGAAAATSDSGHGASATFKLTITSFLRAVEEKGKASRQTDTPDARVGAAADAADVVPALNDQQLRDDALRKAEIPPEYEDIVRRVYSLRANQ